jgi:hypothetical protein
VVAHNIWAGTDNSLTSRAVPSGHGQPYCLPLRREFGDKLAKVFRDSPQKAQWDMAARA